MIPQLDPFQWAILGLASGLTISFIIILCRNPSCKNTSNDTTAQGRLAHIQDTLAAPERAKEVIYMAQSVKEKSDVVTATSSVLLPAIAFAAPAIKIRQW